MAIEPEKLWDRLALDGCNEDRELILAVLLELPAKVQNYAIERCFFISMWEGDLGRVLPGRIGTRSNTGEEKWLVLLNATELDKLEEEEAMGWVAHEIAHAYLEHDRLGSTDEKVEEDAAHLAAEWGFKGPGADVEYQKRVWATPSTE